MRMRTPLIVVLALAAPVAVALSAPTPVQRTVPCSESIDTTRFPYLGSSQPQQRYRLVLEAVSVPPAYLEQVIATHEQPWRYWRKTGLVVRANGQPVTVTVPESWRTRVAITWGNGGPDVVSSLRIAGCGTSPQAGNAYAGGFYLRSGSACVPLSFTVGARSATVPFGIGRRCE
jgi:hypothetical protein